MKLVTSSLLAIALAVGLAGGPAAAKDFTIGSPPVAVITVPDSWNPSVSDDGVEATAPDGLYFAAEAVSIKDVSTATQEGIAYFQSQGVTLDQSSMKQSSSKVGPYESVDVRWTGKDEDGPTNVGMSFVIISETQSVLAYFWGDDAAIAKADSDLAGIAKSLRAVSR